MADNLLDENKNTADSEKCDEIDESLRCGWRSWRPEFLQTFLSPKWFILFISIFSLTQGLIVNGLVTVSIPDIEREFGFSSANSGTILAFNDIAGIILVPLVSFFGTEGRKPKWIGCGALITGVGALLFSLPKAMIGKYNIPGTSLGNSFCIPNGTLTPRCAEKGSNAGYLAVLCLAQFIMGAGTTPLYTLGPTYLDENVNPKVSPIYLGFWFATTFFGPGLGYVVGGTFLRTFTDLKLPKGVHLKLTDPRWVGAWWMGFFLLSWSLLFSGLILLCFPREMPAFKKKRLEALEKGDLKTADQEIRKDIRGFITATYRLVKNVTFIFAVLGLTVRVFFGSAMGSFFAKIVLLKFGGSSFEVALSMGAVLLPAMGGGILIGSIIMKKIKLRNSAKPAALLCAVLSLLTCCGSSIFLVPGCQTTVLAGANSPYQNRTLTGSLNSPCNEKCSCSRQMYAPVCGIDGKTYFSPCFAGCQIPVGKMKFTKCRCISKTAFNQSHMFEVNRNMQNEKSQNRSGVLNTTNSTSSGNETANFEAKFGICDRNCKNLVYFLLASFVLISTTFLSATPQNMILLRCVPDNQRAYALGLQFLFMRSLSFIPAPVIFGLIIDSQCILWSKDDCGNRGNCLDYRVDSLSKNIVYLGITCGMIGTLFYFIAWFFYKPVDSAEKGVLLKDTTATTSKNEDI